MPGTSSLPQQFASSLASSLGQHQQFGQFGSLAKRVLVLDSAAATEEPRGAPSRVGTSSGPQTPEQEFLDQCAPYDFGA